MLLLVLLGGETTDELVGIRVFDSAPGKRVVLVCVCVCVYICTGKKEENVHVRLGTSNTTQHNTTIWSVFLQVKQTPPPHCMFP